MAGIPHKFAFTAVASLALYIPMILFSCDASGEPKASCCFHPWDIRIEKLSRMQKVIWGEEMTTSLYNFGELEFHPQIE